MKKYKNCPTCGGTAAYISKNFEAGDVLIKMESESLQKELQEASKVIVELELVIEKQSNINSLSSTQIFQIYLSKLKQETEETRMLIVKQNEVIKEYITKNPLEYIKLSKFNSPQTILDYIYKKHFESETD